MKIINDNKFASITVLTIIILGLIFYWYEYRPYQIKKKCSREFSSTGLSVMAGFGKKPFNEKEFESCLHIYGL